MSPDLEKLRRFALAIGLVLITYSLAAVELDVGETVHPLGVPLKINRPEWLGIGLVLASLYAVARFWYYGPMLERSPKQQRASLIRTATLEGASYHASLQTVEDAREYLRMVLDAYPRFLGRDVLRTVSGTKVVWSVSQRQRFAARIRDVDYFAPIWVNAIALGTWCWRLGQLWLAITGVAFVALVGLGTHKLVERYPPRNPKE